MNKIKRECIKFICIIDIMENCGEQIINISKNKNVIFSNFSFNKVSFLVFIANNGTNFPLSHFHFSELKNFSSCLFFSKENNINYYYVLWLTYWNEMRTIFSRLPVENYFFYPNVEIITIIIGIGITNKILFNEKYWSFNQFSFLAYLII